MCKTYTYLYIKIFIYFLPDSIIFCFSSDSNSGNCMLNLILSSMSGSVFQVQGFSLFKVEVKELGLGGKGERS
jgi:hypothetical protein